MCEKPVAPAIERIDLNRRLCSSDERPHNDIRTTAAVGASRLGQANRTGRHGAENFCFPANWFDDRSVSDIVDLAVAGDTVGQKLGTAALAKPG